MMRSYDIWISNATLVNEGVEYIASVGIKDGRIVEFVPGKTEVPTDTAQKVIEAEGMLCIPGVIDDQVHFREPGLEHKGSIATESLAAICGGVTSFMDMPNCNPQTTTCAAWNDKMRRASEVSYANYSFYLGATNDNVEELQYLDLEHTPGVKVFMGASTGNMLVDNEDTLRRIFAESPLLIAVHSESEEVIQRNKAAYVEQYGEEVPIAAHPLIRSTEACYESTVKAIALARETGARLHILHLSTAAELSLFADAELPLAQKKITSEVCVHHLWFDDSQYETLGSRIKWNPAVKTQADRDALRQAVRARQIDVIATDHAPHLPSEKEGGALKAASGGPLVQHSLVMAFELVRDGVMTTTDVVDMMCHRPAELFGVVERGYIRLGYWADLVLLRQDSPWIVTDDNVRYKCGWTPLHGSTLHTQVDTTILNGVVVVAGGHPTGVRAAAALRFCHPKR